jgi:cytochrome c oxidase assembly protein subunit 11
MSNSIKKTLFFSALASIAMFGLSFAMVPLYNAYCKISGINTASRINTLPIDATRSITIQFIATNNQELPWEFFPRTTHITVHPNQDTKIYFHVKNTTAKTMTVQAIPSFTPQNAGQFFYKIECFCFKKQTLQAGESREMPMIFHIDNKIPKDLDTMTLAYTLFDVTETSTGKPS